MDTKHHVILPPDLVERCRLHGEQIVQWYRDNPASRSAQVSVLGIEADAKEQAEAKAAECAFALWAGRDPCQAVRWDDSADAGWDVVLAGRCRVDVKRTKAHYRYLIWSFGKKFFEDVECDALVLAKGSVPSFLMAGWISKFDFLQQRQVAGPGHALEAGTWFMAEENLSKMDALAAYRRLIGVA